MKNFLLISSLFLLQSKYNEFQLIKLLNKAILLFWTQRKKLLFVFKNRYKKPNKRFMSKTLLKISREALESKIRITELFVRLT
jgi:hypothetical protein